MKIGIYGNLGHSAMAIHQGRDFPNSKYMGYCPSFQGEDLSRLKNGFKEYGINTNLYATLDQLLATNLDVLVIDNYFSEHASIAKKALERGVHVFCEKPLATTLKELNCLKNTQQASKCELWAMHTLRYHPAIYTMKRTIEKGDIGKIRMITCQKSYRFGTRPEFYKDENVYGGTIPWVAIHGLDAIQYLFPKNCHFVYASQSSLHNYGYGSMETTTVTNLLLEEEVLALVHTDFYRPENAASHGDDRVRVVGTEGILELKENELRLINAANNGSEPLPLLTPPSLFQEFLACVKTGASGELSTKDSFYLSRLALTARESALTKQPLPFA